ncbi:MAG: transposase family protein [Rhodococcus sp.]|nr:transposase family protein [Rhodococcus sp. (in: high G+C Gram-positive bacteria)]
MESVDWGGYDRLGDGSSSYTIIVTRNEWCPQSHLLPRMPWCLTLSILEVLGRVPAPRARREIRHRLAVILSITLATVCVGARSFTAFAERAGGSTTSARDSGGSSHRNRRCR